MLLFGVNIDQSGVGDDDWVQGARRAVTPDELGDIDRLHRYDDRLRGLVGRLLIRLGLITMLGVDHRQLILGRSDRGKPILLSPESSVSFNISHQSSWVIFAGSLGEKVGVDIVDLPAVHNPDQYIKLIENCLVISELRLIARWRLPRHRLAQFMIIWALKESYLKAIGLGLYIELNRLEFQCLSEREVGQVLGNQDDKDVFPASMLRSIFTLTFDHVPQHDWMFQLIRVDGKHIVSLARKGCTPDEMGTIVPLHSSDLILSPIFPL